MCRLREADGDALGYHSFENSPLMLQLSLKLFAPVYLAMLLACQAQVPNLRLKQGVTSIDRVEEVITNWTPDRHVFVKGDIGVGRQQLDGLQNWIDQNAPHWTVVLLDHANGDRFRAADGRDYEGLDAVEHALGHGLGNRTDFGKLEHPLTNERDGAVFVLFLQERKFSYYGSDAQDRRGLGEANWVGELDQPAFRAMRGGGRIVDAARDTIQSINDKLAKAIQSEKASAQRAQQERERTVDEVRRGAVAARERFTDVKIEAAGFREKNPTATGPLAAPPLVRWESEIAAIEAELSPDSARELKQRLAVLNDEVEMYLNAYAAEEGFLARARAIRQKLELLAKAPAGVANTAIAETQKLIAEAEAASKAGALGIESVLSKADAALAAGQTRLQQEIERQKQAELRRTWIRRTVLFMLGVLALVSIAILFMLNRRRRPAMLQAQAELAKREASVTEETDAINDLFVRNEDILGSREQLKKRGYEGLTQQVSEQALNYVDDLFILSKELRRVVSDAKELVYPSSLSGRIVNLFSGSRYQQAVNVVSGKPLRFNRLDGLPLVLHDQVPQQSDGSLPNVISMTFEDVFKAFQKRGDEAEKALDTIETALTSVNDALSALQRDLEQTTQVEKELADAALKDHYFSLPNFFEKLIPSVQSDVATADKLSAFNAVQAMQESIPAARRKLTEAVALANQLANAREKLFPILTLQADRLKKLGYTSTWIDDDLFHISRTANALMQKATEQTIAVEIGELAAKLKHLKSKAELSVQLAQRIDEELAPAIKQLSEHVESDRNFLARSLNVSIDLVLNEPERDPDDWLAAAAKKLETARSTLALGRNEVVQLAIEAMQNDVSQANGILQASLQAVENFSQRRQLAASELERLRQRVPQVEQELQPVQRSYEASALMLQDVDDGDDTTPQQVLSVAAMIQAAAAPIGQVDNLLEQSNRQHQQAKVLQAQDLLIEVASILAHSHQRLDLAQQHLQSIEAQTRENTTELQRLVDQCAALQKNSDDPLVMGRTLSAVNQLKQSIDGWRRDVVAGQVSRNPFEVHKQFTELKQTLVQLNAQCAADRQAHAEAARAFAGAERQMQAAEQLVRQSQTDGIPDSHVIMQANTKIASLARSLASVERELNAPHGSWKDVDDNASNIHVELRNATDSLSGELQNANQALANFQAASQAVFQAEQWSGAYGIRVAGSPGVHELERARSGLQQGNYSMVLDLTKIAMSAAQVAVQQAEREVTRRRIAEQQAAEAERRRRAAQRQSSSPFGGGGVTIGGLGGGSRGGSFGGGSSPSSSSGRDNTSGFGRSGW